MAMRWSRCVVTVAPPRAWLVPPVTVNVSPSTCADTPLAFNPAAVAASRSLSLTLSSANPCMTVEPLGESRNDSQNGVFIDHRRGPAPPAQSRPRAANARMRTSATGSPHSSRSFSKLMSAPISRSVSKKPILVGLIRISVNCNIRIRNDRCCRGEKRRRTRIAGHDHFPACQFGIAGNGNAGGTAVSRHVHICPEVAQHTLGMVTGGFRLDHAGCARRMGDLR